MARKKTEVPALRYHISGQSICQISGVTYYLGKHNSPESIARYAVLIREYQSNGLSVPSHVTSETLRTLAEQFLVPALAVNQSDDPILIKHVAEGYVTHCEEYYRDDPEALRKARRVCNDIVLQFGDVLATEYGPVKLRSLRETWVNANISRLYANSLTNLIIRMFKWAVGEELVPADVYVRLRAIEPLRKGKTKARENLPVKAVNLEHVRATAAFLSPALKAMLRIQLATGMRPSELCIIRPCDIDRTGEEWLYTPSHHKCSNKNKDRVIPIVGDARTAITDYLNRHPESFCFSPKETVAWHQSKKRAERKTKVQPSQLDRSKEKPMIQPRDCYDKDSYRRALQRAAKQAGVPQWTPYEVRHLVGTVVAESLKLESAKALLGHSDIVTTQRYSKATTRQAIEAAKHAPRLEDLKNHTDHQNNRQKI